MTKKIPKPKPEFIERMKLIFPQEKDFKEYFKSLETQPPKSIRCNTLKISPEELKKRIEQDYNWKIIQPFKQNPEVMIIDESGNTLLPGELGRSKEHLLGYYYIQEIASMLPIISLNPKPKENFLDLCSAPGSKTTQATSKMKNTGLIIANEISSGRIKILSTNLGRCGVSNAILTKKDGIALCKRLKNERIEFDKILVDAPCSGEGTLRSSPKTSLMWNPKTIKSLSKLQKELASSAIEILKEGGEMIYSTCTHAPEENEEVLDYLIKNHNIKVLPTSLPKELKTREGLTIWKEKTYNEKVKLSSRIYPQDNNTDGFFLTRIKKL